MYAISSPRPASTHHCKAEGMEIRKMYSVGPVYITIGIYNVFKIFENLVLWTGIYNVFYNGVYDIYVC